MLRCSSDPHVGWKWVLKQHRAKAYFWAPVESGFLKLHQHALTCMKNTYTLLMVFLSVLLSHNWLINLYIFKVYTWQFDIHKGYRILTIELINTRITLHIYPLFLVRTCEFSSLWKFRLLSPWCTLGPQTLVIWLLKACSFHQPLPVSPSSYPWLPLVCFLIDSSSRP